MNTLEKQLRGRRDAGGKLLVPYLTGGITEDWTDYLAAYRDAGADAIEIGLPFSDPMLDGSTIQEASDRALERGTSVRTILDELTRIETDVPLIAMTYANFVIRDPLAFCSSLRAAGMSGLIVPDMPVDEIAELTDAAAECGIDLVLLAAPSTTADRLERICTHSKGFVYGITVMGTTGERAELAETAAGLGQRLKAITDLPVLLGFGISSPAHAAAAREYADGVVVASALMREVLDGAGPAEVGARLGALRKALDQEP